VPDSLSPSQRSARMASVRQADTAPELAVRRALHASGLRYRLHAKELPGTPDIVLRKYLTVVFVHGCYWHAHACKRFKVPSTRPEFWRKKFEQNRLRDERKEKALEDLGWSVFTVWECELRDEGKLQALVDRIRALAS
jgi:DNA mismatch endonuclease (patch repair protein)